MKKILISLAIAGTALCSVSHAQTGESKLDLATRVVALQQGPELERLVSQLADGATQQLLQTWGQQIQTSVPKARQQQAGEQLSVELKSYFADVSKVIEAKVKPVSSETLVPAYMEKFTADELRQIATFFESPAVKKYQLLAPELGNTFVKQLVESTRGEVTARARQFDVKAEKIVGSAPSPAEKPAAASKAAPAPKK